MAQSARDPYWRSQVGLETALYPSQRAAIEDKCLRCHAPAQQYAGRAQNKQMALADLNESGRGGVTCSVCHQIGPELGTKATFTGGFQIGTQGLIFGPHANPFTMPMRHHTPYTPTEGKHIVESSMCATCHTVLTHPSDFEPQAPAEFYEQAPFLEWMASDYPGLGLTCQKCHVPAISDSSGRPAASYIAHNPMGRFFPPTSPRTPFGLHWFFGGNVQMPRTLALLNEEWRAPLERTAARNFDFLQTSLDLDVKTRFGPDANELLVQVSNATGHKLPTGVASRRLWLHVTVLDASGKVLFESGAWDPATGSLAAGDAQPHHERISDPSQVMVYEAEYADQAGNVTHSFLKAARFAKDNRLLPAGWDLSRVNLPGVQAAAIAPVAVIGDPTFSDGTDEVIYELTPAVAKLAATVRVEACWQSLKPAHARAAMATGEPAVWQAYQKNAAPVVIARAEEAIAQSARR